MKKLLISCLAVLSTAVLFAPGTASAYLTNWYLDPDGAAGVIAPIKISETLNINGTNFIWNDFSTPVPTFQEWGTFQSLTHDGGGMYSGQELGATFMAQGVLNGTQSFAFTGGTFEVYAQTIGTYSGTSGIYGSNVGTKIGTFTLVSGGGDLQDNYLPNTNGQITAIFAAQELAPGYWFDSNMYDLSNLDLLSNPFTFTLGFATTNASILNNINVGDLIVSEYDEFVGLDFPTPANGNYLQPPNYFFVGNGGQFRLAVVPEPTSMVLLGIGMLGLAAVRRNKRATA